MSDDRDKTPDPEAESNPLERTRAAGFARLVDGLLDGDALPPAMDAEDRALLETATMVVASTREVGFGAERSGAVIDDALEQALTGNRRPTTLSPVAAENDDGGARSRPRDDTDVIHLGRRRADRLVRALPWFVASVAAAAAIILFVTRPERGDHLLTSAASAAELTSVHRSRPADPLVGEIARARADRASDRLDAIYADRMSGYRDLRLRGYSGAAPAASPRETP